MPAPRCLPAARLAALATFCFAFALYAPTTRFGFVWDDHQLVEQNPIVRAEAPWAAVFGTHLFASSEDASTGRFYRPLVVASYRLNWAISPAPGGFHLVNALLHALCCLLVLLVSLQAGAPIWAALTSALLFAAWSGHTEPVSWIAGRTDLLLALGSGSLLLGVFMLRAGAAQQRASGPWIALSALGGLVAALSKEPGMVVLAASIPLTIYLLQPATRRVRITASALLVVAFGVALGLRQLALASTSSSPFLYDGDLSRALARIGLQLSLASGFDLRLLPAPPVTDVERWAFIGLMLAVCGGILTVIIRLRRRHPPAAALLLLGLLALLPVAAARLPALRYLYLPLFLCAPAGALGLARLGASARRRSIIVGVAVLVLFAWTAMGQIRLPAWRSDDALFAHEAAQNPESADAQFFQGLRLLERGLGPRAAHTFERILRRDPGHRPSWLGLTRAWIIAGELDRAERAIRASLRGEPKTSPQYVLLGEVLLARLRYHAALQAFEQALRFQPDGREALNGAIRAAQGVGDEALVGHLRRRLARTTSARRAMR